MENRQRSYQKFLEKGRQDWGDKFSDENLNPAFIPFFENGKRIEVEFPWGERKRGRIGVSTGWMPIFLLMLTRRSMGSSWTIRENERVVKIISD